MLKVVPLDVKQRGPYQQAENAAGRTSRPKMLSGPTDVPRKLLTLSSTEEHTLPLKNGGGEQLTLCVGLLP